MWDEQSEYRIWLSQQLDGLGRGARLRLAKFLGRSPDQITRMTNIDPNKESRDISLAERLSIQEFMDKELAEKNESGFAEAQAPFDTEATLQGFHKVLEKLESDDRRLILGWSTAIAERLNRS